MSDLTRPPALATAASCSKILGANDRVRLRYIGLGNRGDQVYDADILTEHLSTSATLIGNIAHKTQSVLKWDAHPGRFTTNDGCPWPELHRP